MKLKGLFIPLVFLFSFFTNAQNVKVNGTVKDSIGNPLELANVLATIKATGKIETYSITSKEGRYQLVLPVNADYILKISFLGFAPQSKELKIGANSEDITMDFVLKPLTNELEGVELVSDIPVTVKGDTIVYAADAFTNGREKKLGDVLKKLPGVEVTDDGEIEVEGKTVSKVMVEGKDFFDGDSKLATRNIPADAVNKVEVLKNYNEISQLRGLGNDQDNIAINIKLKEGKKKFWFGEVTAGIGDGEQTRYLAHPKLFYYSPKTSINIITDFNNIGEVPFTRRDYFNFTGGFRNFNRNGGTSFNISDSGLGFAVAQNNRANEIETGFFAANFSHEISSKWDISGFSILSDNKTNFVETSIRRFIQTNVTETNTSDSDQRSQLGMLKLSSVFKPHNNFQLDYDALIKISDESEFATALSVFEDVINPIIESKENKPVSVNQNANIYYTLNDKNIFAAQVQYLYQDEDPFYNAIVQQQPFVGILPVDLNQSAFDINQERNVVSNKLDAKVDYYYVINNKSNLNFSIGSTLSKQDFNSSIFQLLDNEQELSFDEEELNNDVTFYFTDLFFGLHYKFKTGIFTFTPGATLHSYTTKSDQLGLETDQNDILLLPDLFAIAQLGQSETIRFNYRMTADYTDINNFAEGLIFNNYNRLFRGNRNIENAIFHNYNLSYFNFNLFSYVNIVGSLNYTRRVDAIKNNTEIVAINQVSAPINSNFVDEVYSANGRFSKNFRKFKINTNASLSQSNLNNIVNGENRESTSFTQNYRSSIETNFKKGFNFEVGYNRIINDYDNGGVISKFFTDRPFVNFELNFLKSFTLDAEWNYYNYTNDDDTIQNEYSFLSANLYYQKEGSKWEFKIQGTNLLDVDDINQDSFNENFSTTTRFFVQPRILMLIVKYNL
ncbi:TonB-dependent receptor [Leptobacterium flavescens]|uniref:TonB-dependent receptor n=1 Tax=Leptobacterium flavescens TaxID=472055 RepID=A0A6P0UQ69_9FLAO|nr:TonB-dependent receptor [Leptobacterium flavescens]NER12536.1 TonB-dependent receptor [Leptobacterium flavescens]